MAYRTISIEANNLKKYTKREVVKDVDLVVKKGEVVGFPIRMVRERQQLFI